jgi:hypothetical protein
MQLTYLVFKFQAGHMIHVSIAVEEIALQCSSRSLCLEEKKLKTFIFIIGSAGVLVEALHFIRQCA